MPPGHLSPVNLHLPHVVTELADKQKPNKKNRKRRLESKVESNDPANGEAKFGYKKYKKKLKSDSITNSPVSGMFIKVQEIHIIPLPRVFAHLSKIYTNHVIGLL